VSELKKRIKMKNNYLSSRYRKDFGNAMGESDVLAKSFDDVINMSIGDPDKTTPEEIINAAFADAKAGYTGYSDFQGDPELRRSISKYYFEEFGMEVDDNEILITSSATPGMYLTLEAILEDGDEVIMQAPFFSPYPDQVRLARGTPVELPTYEEEDFQISVERLRSLISHRTKALIINTPSNPTGSCLTIETMMGIAEIAEANDLVVVADDIYIDYSYENPFVPFASLPGMRERTVTLNSFSKGFNMTGWRVGSVIAPAYLIKAMQFINDNVCFTVPTISQRAAVYALNHRHEIQPEIVEEYRKRMYYAAERANRIPWMHVIYPPKGAFYLFPSIKATGLTSVEVADRILREAHVLVLPGNAFGECGEGHLRMSLTVSFEEIEEAFDRLEKIRF